MKRKHDNQDASDGPAPKTSKTNLKSRFRSDLYEQNILDQYTSAYTESSPYVYVPWRLQVFTDMQKL